MSDCESLTGKDLRLVEPANRKEQYLLSALREVIVACNPDRLSTAADYMYLATAESNTELIYNH
jgi:hypothetical protein